ncbi:hypothetical protein [uncultured Flavobacterium sp.]|uniref:hypothetical protein n=1 Tax=uncultured Flavobacterium sp. TaxID=165435 RepID=UPI0027E0A1E9|nr:hypothetical protein [uncultured Flavobacterium sp.]
MARINNEKEHYRSLIDLFKFALSLLSVFGIIIGYIVYSDGKEMRQDQKERRIELESNFKDMKQDLEKQKAEHKNELLLQKSEMESDRERLTKRFEDEINWTKAQAIYEIANVKTTSKEIAQTEAKKKINEVFDNKNFDDYVAKIAEERMKPQINDLVDKKLTANINVLIEDAIQNLYSPDMNKFMEGIAYLQINRHIKLTELQIQKIIKATNNINKDYRPGVIAILLFKESQSSTNFFIKELQSENNMSQLFSLQYFAYNNIYAPLSDALYSIISKHSDLYGLYFNAIEASSGINQQHTMSLLNSKQLVDLIYPNIPKEQLQYHKENTLRILKDKDFKEERIISSYFFKK